MPSSDEFVLNVLFFKAKILQYILNFLIFKTSLKRSKEKRYLKPVVAVYFNQVFFWYRTDHTSVNSPCIDHQTKQTQFRTIYKSLLSHIWSCNAKFGIIIIANLIYIIPWCCYVAKQSFSRSQSRFLEIVNQRLWGKKKRKQTLVSGQIHPFRQDFAISLLGEELTKSINSWDVRMPFKACYW